MMNKFKKTIHVRWSDCDPNRHVRHSAYYDYGAHVRIRFFSELGFSADKMNALNLGPILFKEECSFIKEIRPEDTVTVNVLKGEITPDGARWKLHHEIYNQHGEKSAHITIKGAWLDLKARKLTLPPIELAQAMHELTAGEDYVYRKKKK